MIGDVNNWTKTIFDNLWDAFIHQGIWIIFLLVVIVGLISWLIKRSMRIRRLKASAKIIKYVNKKRKIRNKRM